VTNGSIRIPTAGFSVSGLNVALPVNVAYPSPAVADDKGQPGFLAFDALDEGEFHAGRQRLPLVVNRNRVALPRSRAFSCTGGRHG
jgi:hypothetical protein